MTKQEILNDLQSLIQSIDTCENELVKARLTDDMSRLVRAYSEAGSANDLVAELKCDNLQLKAELKALQKKCDDLERKRW